MWKICTKCKKHKALWAFHKNKNKWLGVGSWCKICKAIDDKLYREENKKAISKQRFKFRKENKKRIKEQRKIYWQNNKECINIKRKSYRKENIEVFRNRGKKSRESNACFESMKNKLTIDEKPRLGKDGHSLEVKCKYCKQYFIPTKADAWRRALAITGHNKGECNLYCSEECKITCSTYNSRGVIINKTYRESIPEELRQIVFKRCNYICEKCGVNKATICHHIHPVAYEPMLQADPDSCMGVCEKCHDKIHHQPGCTYPELRKNSVNNCDV